MSILTFLMGWGNPILKVKISINGLYGSIAWDISEKAKRQEVDYKTYFAVMYIAKMISNLGSTNEFLLLDKLAETLQNLKENNLKRTKILPTGQLLKEEISNPQFVFSAELYEKPNGALNLQTHANIKNKLLLLDKDIDPVTPFSVYLLWQDLTNTLSTRQLKIVAVGINSIVSFYKSKTWGLTDLVEATRCGLISVAQYVGENDGNEI